jgi:uncharacterized membrane protein YfcA
MVFPMGALAAMEYNKAGQIDIKTAGIMTLTLVAASYFGSKMATNVDPQTLRKVFAVAQFSSHLKYF